MTELQAAEREQESSGVEARELGESFGGTVVRVDADDCDAFFLEHQDEFTIDGQTHYLRLMGVGKALYDNQTEPTRVSILAAQKGKVRAAAEGIYVLRNTEGKLFFAGYATRIGWEDPRSFLDLSEAEGWVLSADDEKRGILRFTKPVEKTEGDWAPAVFADVPYLYGKPVALSVGLYNAYLNAAMRDILNTTGYLKFKMDEFASDEFIHAAEVLTAVAKENSEVYGKFLGALRHKKVLIEPAREWVREAAAENRLPRFQTAPTLKYLDVLERGGEVDTLAPQQLKDFQDLVNALALYGREGAKSSMPSLARAENLLFRAAFEDVYEADGGELPPYVDLKERVQQRS